jgi:hypothetical protein
VANFLLTWELGGGLGHLGPLAVVARELAARGHRVELAVPDPVHARKLAPDLRFLPAAVHRPPPGEAIAEPSTLADVLHNAGCADRKALAALVAAWEAHFEAVRPDVVVMDFSPTALVALQGSPARRALLGFGYGVPPDVTPLPDLCPWRDNYPQRLAMTEAAVLAGLNAQLAAQHQPPLARVAELFNRVDSRILTTFAELDHYQNRPGAEYWGVLSDWRGAAPAWPSGGRPRVLAYLQPAPVVGQLLGELARRGFSTLAYVPRSPAAELSHSSVRVTSDPLDLGALLPQADLAILHAGHFTTARALLAGKPLLLLPISGEQQLVAENSVRLGAAVTADLEAASIFPALDRLASDESCALAARRFAERYADFDSRRALERIAGHLESLAGRWSAR